MNLRMAVIQQFKDLLAYNGADVESLKDIASAKGFIYAIVDRTGKVHTTRRSFGAANRILAKGNFSYFSAAMTDKERLTREYQVVTVHLSDFK